VDTTARPKRDTRRGQLTRLPDQPAPRVPDPARRLSERAFAALARRRGGRAFHPRGTSFEAHLEPLPGREGSPLPFVPARPWPSLVRLSKAAGLPPHLPDVHGLAVRLTDLHGPGRSQDLLLASSGQAPVLRHLLVPTRGFTHRRFSSLLMYRWRGRLVLIGARYAGGAARIRLDEVVEAAAAGVLTFDLGVATLLGRWVPVARLNLRRPLLAAASEALRFHPWNTAPTLVPVGPLNHLRAPAYEASQRTATSE
jgi:hypothetical protein